MPKADLDRLVNQAQAGQLVSFPTDTVPALASLPHQASQIFAAKRRQPDKPLILMAATAADLWPYVSGSAQELATWQRTAQTYWPGPVTLVLPAIADLPTAINPQQTGTVGIRVPNHGIAQQILARTGPLATTSANRSGDDPLLTMADIAAQFPEVWTLDLATVASQGSPNARGTDFKSPTPPSDRIEANGVPSTVVQWTHNQWQILRQGAVQVKL